MKRVLKKLFKVSEYQGELIHQCVYSRGIIKVYEDKNTRWMTFTNDDIQTAMTLADPYALSLSYMRTMMSFLLFQPMPKSAVLLGLGGGGLVRFLHHHFPELVLDVVDISSEVIEIAQQYFSLPEAETIRIHCEDGIHYLEERVQCVDTMIVDMFCRQGLPAFMLKPAFYQQCYQALSEQGVAIINLLANSTHELLYIINLIRTAFAGQTVCVAVKNTENVIVFAFKEKLKDRSFDQLVERSALFKARYVGDVGLYIQDVLNMQPRAITAEFPNLAKIVY